MLLMLLSKAQEQALAELAYVTSQPAAYQGFLAVQNISCHVAHAAAGSLSMIDAALLHTDMGPAGQDTRQHTDRCVCEVLVAGCLCRDAEALGQKLRLLRVGLRTIPTFSQRFLTAQYVSAAVT